MARTLQIVYYDGQFDDARMNVTLATSAALAGATVLNYTEVIRLLKVAASPSSDSHVKSDLSAADECADAWLFAMLLCSFSVSLSSIYA